jgi:hypothetical protein
MLKSIALVLGLLAASSGASGAEYSTGWSFENFYQEVVTCKAAIVMPAAATYIERGHADKQSEESLRSEVISMSRIFDQTAAAGCFCAINELAKTTPYKSYEGLAQQARLQAIGNILEGSVCSDRISIVMQMLQKPGAKEALILK